MSKRRPRNGQQLQAEVNTRLMVMCGMQGVAHATCGKWWMLVALARRAVEDGRKCGLGQAPPGGFAHARGGELRERRLPGVRCMLHTRRAIWEWRPGWPMRARSACRVLPRTRPVAGTGRKRSPADAGSGLQPDGCRCSRACRWWPDSSRLHADTRSMNASQPPGLAVGGAPCLGRELPAAVPAATGQGRQCRRAVIALPGRAQKRKPGLRRASRGQVRQKR